MAGRFIDAYRIRDGVIVDQKDRWRRQVDFDIKLLANFASQGYLNRTRTDIQKVHIPPAMRKPLRDFEEYCRDRRHLRPTTLSGRIREIAIFLGFFGLTKYQFPGSDAARRSECICCLPPQSEAQNRCPNCLRCSIFRKVFDSAGNSPARSQRGANDDSITP